MKHRVLLALSVLATVCATASGRPGEGAPRHCYAMRPVNNYYNAGTCYSCPGNYYEAVEADSGFAYIYTTGYATVTCSQGMTVVRPDGSRYCDLSNAIQTQQSHSSTVANSANDALRLQNGDLLGRTCLLVFLCPGGCQR